MPMKADFFKKFLKSFRGLKHPIKKGWFLKKKNVSSSKILWDIKRDNEKGPSEHLKEDVVCVCVCVYREREREDYREIKTCNS